MDVISEPVRTMVWLSLLTGLRIGEVLGLPWKNVDFTSGQIRVTQAFYRGTIGSPKTKMQQTPGFDSDRSQNGLNQAARELEARGTGFRFRPLSERS
jgi:integrase